jgi:hypothetical protein
MRLDPQTLSNIIMGAVPGGGFSGGIMAKPDHLDLPGYACEIK